jgi:hypothetical protein
MPRIYLRFANLKRNEELNAQTPVNVWGHMCTAPPLSASLAVLLTRNVVFKTAVRRHQPLGARLGKDDNVRSRLLAKSAQAAAKACRQTLHLVERLPLVVTQQVLQAMSCL